MPTALYFQSFDRIVAVQNNSDINVVPSSALQGAPGVSPSAIPDSFLRIPADKVSRLMDMVGELSLSVAEILHCPELAGLELDEFDKATHRLQLIVGEVQNLSAELRQLPIGDVFKRLRRTVRELERQTGKAVDLVLFGEEVEIDKLVADRLYEPLVHVLRNSVDHGIETMEARRAAGKPERGTITLRAAQTGGEMAITVADDGRGLQRDRILQRAYERGLVPAGEVPPDNAIWQLIFEPGFSTAEAVTNLSGRGVGMDVLNTTIKELRGRIDVDTVPGAGTDVVLTIPLSLAFLDTLVMRVGTQRFAVPVDTVSEVLRPEQAQLKTISADNGGQYVDIRGSLVRLCALPEFYGADAVPRTTQDSILLIVNTRQGPIGLPVDEMYDQQKVVMKPLQGQLAGIRACLGCAVLGTGDVAMVLDCDALVRRNAA